MRARFYSDTSLDNFVDEASDIFDVVDVVTQPGNRDVTIPSSGQLTEELRALVQLNGGDVLSEAAE